jgi:DNA-binding NarL/FixJ family response regulator
MHTILPVGTVAPPTGKRRILIVDDHTFFAACLRTLLDNESDLVVCDVTTNSVELNDRIERLRPDLLVIDLSLGAENGVELGKRLRGQQVRTPILFVSTLGRPTREQLEEVAHCAFVAKSRKPADFLAILREVLEPRDAAWRTKARLEFAGVVAKA